MSGYTIYDSEADLFLVYDNNDYWVWATFNNKLEKNIPFSVISERKIEGFLNSVKSGTGKEVGHNGQFINAVVSAMPNVWLIRMVEEYSYSTRYRLYYSDGIKV